MKTIALLLCLLVVSCGQAAENGSDTVSADVRKAADIANAIEANPDGMDEILAKHSMTAESFSDLMYEIAEDEKKSADFERLRGR